MIDTVKRTTLKRFGMAAVAVATAGAAGSVIAQNTPAMDSSSALKEPLSLAELKVHTRVSTSTNDIEVLITNTGSQATRITQLTPAQTVTKRGSFKFAELLTEGELHLAAGQSVTVPMTPHPVVIDASTSAVERAQSLTTSLQRSFSAITENESFARVTVVDGIRFI